MMNLITWNIQCGRGCDGRVDFKRIVDTALAMADVDVLCFQEVGRDHPGYLGSVGEDQFAALAGLLPGYRRIEGVATDTPGPDGTRRQFGNVIFSRLPVLQIFPHLLPWPADPRRQGMQRVALEAVLRAKTQLVRVTTTHLEYYSAKQRAAQLEKLRELHAESAAHANDAARPDTVGEPFEVFTRPVSGILTGDFNFQPEDPLHLRLTAAYADATPRYRDAWELRYPGKTHDPTLGVFDHQYTQQPFCCDFVFVTENIADKVREVKVNLETGASDHQPVLIELDI
jgi:endonuclease/exonuclease/phosphatase family metal-dependent hydrolase